ncbi:exopolysaccharide biosynthesis protein [Allosphingosinicella sp.]|uniref:exopolysaccharide biosynthesis protein n=1 Tax=Allosphingosinicella sp. TaxID=2823234 RepID=UPI003785087A
MTKHNPRSLLERAAEMYDFGAALRGPAAAPEVAPEPVAAPARPPVELAPAPTTAEAPKPVPAPLPVRPAVVVAPAPVAGGNEADISREMLAANGFIVPGAPMTALAEEFRLLKRQLLSDVAAAKRQSEEKRRSILVCSAQPKEGKTFCAINLALSLAGESELEVLLVEADFLKPDTLGRLGIPGGPGFVDALLDPDVDPESFVIRTDVPGLSVLPAGAKTNNVPELLASDRSREVLAKLVAGNQRRIVIFDSPPVLMASHATVLAGLVGRALVVVRADRTTEADLREAIGHLQGCEISLMLNGAGLAVTGRKFGSYDGYGHDD